MVDVIKKIGESGISEESITTILKEAGQFNLDKKSKEIIDAKNAEIRDLKKKILLLQNKESAKNVVNNKQKD